MEPVVGRRLDRLDRARRRHRHEREVPQDSVDARRDRFRGSTAPTGSPSGSSAWVPSGSVSRGMSAMISVGSRPSVRRLLVRDRLEDLDPRSSDSPGAIDATSPSSTAIPRRQRGVPTGPRDATRRGPRAPAASPSRTGDRSRSRARRPAKTRSRPRSRIIQPICLRCMPTARNRPSSRMRS